MSKRQGNPAGDFYCTRCGKRGIPLYRNTGRGRESGHLKKLYCIYCKEEVNSVEVKMSVNYDYNDFMLEFKYNNFDNDGNRKMEYKQFRKKLYEEGII